MNEDDVRRIVREELAKTSGAASLSASTHAPEVGSEEVPAIADDAGHDEHGRVGAASPSPLGTSERAAPIPVRDQRAEIDAKLYEVNEVLLKVATATVQSQAEEIRRLKEQLASYEAADPEMREMLLRDDARTMLLEKASQADADALMKAALGPEWNRLWGPTLESLGHAVDLVMAQRNAAVEELRRLREVLELYSEHTGDCEDEQRRGSQGCTCGLDAALNPPAQEKP